MPESILTQLLLMLVSASTRLRLLAESGSYSGASQLASETQSARTSTLMVAPAAFGVGRSCNIFLAAPTKSCVSSLDCMAWRKPPPPLNTEPYNTSRRLSVHLLQRETERDGDGETRRRWGGSRETGAKPRFCRFMPPNYKAIQDNND